MEICNLNHIQIVFDENRGKCPACVAICATEHANAALQAYCESIARFEVSFVNFQGLIKLAKKQAPLNPLEAQEADIHG